jgi:hypothetical protein
MTASTLLRLHRVIAAAMPHSPSKITPNVHSENECSIAP